ncbi:MAG: hypothetical protein M5R41_08360 [Bacteroidia bacterium]|nr:hypothetical protein [Bacteroidia bacterium]
MKNRTSAGIPLYCDFSCEHASFSDPCAVGACRRDVGVWCNAARRYHTKHARCLLRSDTQNPSFASTTEGAGSGIDRRADEASQKT